MTLPIDLFLSALVTLLVVIDPPGAAPSSSPFLE